MFIAFCLQFIGLLGLSFSMNKHFKMVFHQPLNSSLGKVFQVLGWLLILTSFLLMLQLGVISLLYWLGFLSLEIILLGVFYCWLKD